MNTTIKNNYVLVLNKNWMPVNVISWKDAMTMLVKRCAVALDSKNEYCTYFFDEWVASIKEQQSKYDKHIRCVNMSIPLPEIIIATSFDKTVNGRISMSKENLLFRDEFTCGYCGKELTVATMTIDHVIPQAKGGKTTWTNIVSACRRCNAIKGDKDPHGEFTPKHRLYEPKMSLIISKINCRIKNREIPESWKKFIHQ